MSLRELITILKLHEKEGFELIQKDIEEWDYDDPKEHEAGTYIEVKILLKKVKNG